MTDYVWPEDLAPYVQGFFLQPHVGRSESPFTRQAKIYELSAPRWLTQVSFRGGSDNAGALRDVGGRMDAMIVKLRGGTNRALIWDFRRPTRTGSGGTMEEVAATTVTFTLGETFDEGEVFDLDYSGGPPANEAADAGDVAMTWAGFQPMSLIFKAGDYVGGDGRPHLILDDAVADPDGTVSLSFWPPLADDVAAGAAIFERVTAPFRIAADDAGANATEVGQATTYDFEMIEDL
jgi:hypothetical protein